MLPSEFQWQFQQVKILLEPLDLVLYSPTPIINTLLFLLSFGFHLPSFRHHIIKFHCITNRSTLEMVGLSGQLSQDTHLRTCKIEPQDDMIPRPFWKAHGPGDLRESSTHTMAPNTGGETTPTSSLYHGNVMPRDTWQAWHRSTTPTSPHLECIPFDELVDELTPTQSQLSPPPFSPSVWDRKRAELIRKSSTIYGGHMAKRRHLPLTAHEEGVNEAAFQLCLRDPTLLVRRDELFLLARRAVKKRGYMGGHGDPQGPRSNSPSLMTGSHGQKRSRPSIDGFHGIK